MTDYIQRYNGEWVDVTRGHFVACCDCGLVHEEDFSILDNRILRRSFRDNRLTAVRRRSLQTKKIGLFAKKKKKK